VKRRKNACAVASNMALPPSHLGISLRKGGKKQDAEANIAYTVSFDELID
jgi:hypothetical protein